MSDPFEQLWGPPKATAAGPLTMNLIKGFEGYAPVAKWDVRQHSGGYGSRAKPGEQFTPEIAEQRLHQEVAPINAWLDKNITLPLTPERRAGFSSFAYNLGVDDLEKLKPDINRGDWNTVGNRMLSFNKALNEKTGRLEPLAGLTTRRQKEAALVMGGQMPAAAPQERAQMPMMPQQQRQQGPLANAMSGLPNSMVPGILGGGDEPGYFGKLLSDPTFLTGASVLGAGLSGQDFGTALSRGAHGAAAQSEAFDKRRKAIAWQKMWGQNGQPNADSPLLKGVPPEVLPIIQQMGPEDGMKALQQIAMKRLEPRQLQVMGPGSTAIDSAGNPVYTSPDRESANKPILVDGRLVKEQPDGTFREMYSAPPKPEGLREVSPGSTIYDPSKGAGVFTAPSPPPKPEGLRDVAPGSTIYDPNKGEAVFTAPGGDRVPNGYRLTPDGNLTHIPGGPADPALKVKEVQFSEGASKAANFANMMEQSQAALIRRDPQGNPILGPDGRPATIDNPLGVGGQMNEMFPEAVANRARSPEYQAYRQAAMQWVRAKLRKESGAAISTPEFEGEFQTFFPQPGDTPQVIAQKTQAREAALVGMKAESRGAYDQLFQGAQPGAGAAPGGGIPQQAPPQMPQGAPSPQGAPQPGQVEEGYRFKGGNPADPNSWERIQ